MKSGPDGMWWSSDDAVAYVDEDPWEFPAVKPLIGQAVQLETGQLPAEQRDLERLTEFVLLQRLFRAAMEGQLGDDFPIQNLIELARSTADSVNQTMRTPRWNTHPGALEEILFRAIHLNLPKLEAPKASAFKSELERCDAFLQGIGKMELSTVGQDVWIANCNFSDQSEKVAEFLAGSARDAAETVIRTSAYITDVRELRASIGVAMDQRRSPGDDVCGD
jgi:hypothetical protein